MGYGDGRNDLYVLARQFLGLLSSQDDVLVVGQNDHLIAGDVLYRLEQLFGAGIHRLSAGDDNAGAQTLKYSRQSLTGCDHYGPNTTKRFWWGCRLLCFAQDKVLVLLLHILHDDLAERANTGAIVDRCTGLRRVDMDLHHSRVSHNQRAISQRVNSCTDLLDVQSLTMNDILNVIAVALLAVQVQSVEIHRFGQFGVDR